LGSYRYKSVFRAKFLVCLFIFALSSVSIVECTELPPIQWGKNYFPYTGNCVIQTSDGGYVIAGEKSTPQNIADWLNHTAVLIKVDKAGNLQWTKTYNETLGGGPSVTTVVQAADLGFALFGNQGEKAFIIKTDSYGTVIWSIKREGFLWGGIQTSDGGFLLVGGINGASGFGAWLQKIDANGNVVWDRAFGFPTGFSYVEAYTAIEANGGYLAAGHFGSYGWLIKVDFGGSILWNQTYNLNYPLSTTYAIHSIATGVEGGYVLAGGDFVRSFMIKTDAQGNMMWHSPYAQANTLNSVIQTSNGKGYMATGDSANNQGFLGQFDSSGNIVAWNSSSQIFNSITQSNDGGYAVTGRNDTNIVLVKYAPETMPGYDYTNSILLILVVIIAALGSFGLRKRTYKKSSVKKETELT
jgi:hypothetical protein